MYLFKSKVKSRKSEAESRKLKVKSQKSKVENGKTNVESQSYSLVSVLFVLFSLFYSLFSISQEKPLDSIKKIEEVIVSGVRAKDKNPVTFKNVKKEEIAPRNLGQDIPILLTYLPSVVTTSDAGNGVGYTGFRVRGTDASRTNVTLNGIPWNDSESQGTFFVNLPDFASSLESVQLQRGVGTSTTGAGAFGASLNLQTNNIRQDAFAEIANSFGSFNTRKHTLAFGTGIANGLELNGRISQIYSDGFVDRASSNLFGYFFNVNYQKKNALIKFLAFGGKEKTYQAWYGLDEDKLKENRTYNYAGLYFDGDKEKFYDDQTDNYWQNHFQWHWTQKWSEKLTSNIAAHYTKGKGYYEEYVVKDELNKYGFNVANTLKSDLIRKKWLDNHFYGVTTNLNYTSRIIDVIWGGAFHRYNGKHFGEVLWTEVFGETLQKYYNNSANKNDINTYLKATAKLTKSLELFSDIQFRHVSYAANSVKFDQLFDQFNFWNPKAGLTYFINDKSSLYTYFGVANKEPRRDDYENGSVLPERLEDFELGYRINGEKFNINANAFYMNYRNQLVATGQLNDVGSPIFANSGDSYRAGIEIDAAIKPVNFILWNVNATYSQNKNKNFFFQRDGVLQNLGDTNISFSPNIVAASNLTFLPVKDLQVSVLSKYVGEQYLGNIDSQFSKLPAYLVHDFNINYELKLGKTIQSIVFSALVNNVLDLKYESNGYFFTYDDDFSVLGVISTVEGKGLYPQAVRNFLVGVNLKF